MKIRKLFKFEAAHIVRNCSTVRCRQNIHGHSFKAELVLQASSLDNAGMVLDFGLLKGRISRLVAAFDPSYIIWSEDKGELVDFIRNENERWIELPFSPTAENLALFFHVVIQKIIGSTAPTNGQGDVKVHAVRIHETDTGWAETGPEDTGLFNAMASLAGSCVFSDGIMGSDACWNETWKVISAAPDLCGGPDGPRPFLYEDNV